MDILVVEKDIIEPNLAISKYELDTECIQQSQLFMEAGAKYVEAAEQRDIAKLEMETVWAELDKNMREAAAERKEKMTEGAIENSIQRHPSYQAAHLHYIHKKAQADYAEIRKRAFEQRKSMLELVCKLYLSEYFSDINVKGGKLSQEIELETIKKEVAKGGRRKIE